MLKYALLLFILNAAASDSPPANYTLMSNWEYYGPPIVSGLTADSEAFYLNGKLIYIYSGAFHYWRVPRAYWADRLRKMRAAGLNTIETYIPWNLHNPRPGIYDFGGGDSDMTDFLYLADFLWAAKSADLFVIIRVGPFIGAEFEFGGLPSWLLTDDLIYDSVRTSKFPYWNHVDEYFNVLLPYIYWIQFTVNEGPIIMVQVESSYSSSGMHDTEYLRLLRRKMLDYGIVELLVTADNPNNGDSGTLLDLYLMTANIETEDDPTTQLDTLANLQPRRPRMTMEYKNGGVDYWANTHTPQEVDDFRTRYELVLKYPSSVNVYTFVGGTNFGFLNGAENVNNDDQNSGFSAAVTSYDRDAPISESGNYTEKYWATKELIEKYNPIKTRGPSVPDMVYTTSYGNITIEKQISLENLLATIDPIPSADVVPMEKLNINNGGGQSYGYIVYRKANLDIPANAVLQIEGRVCDTVIVLVNGILVSNVLATAADMDNDVTSHSENIEITLSDAALSAATLDIIVENWGRVSTGLYRQLKGLWQGGVTMNGDALNDWSIYPLEFRTAWTNGLDQWEDVNTDVASPGLYSATLSLVIPPSQDTYIHMENWTKGIVIVNGFVLGRYAKMGPVQTLYLPAAFLNQGNNTIYVFEHYQADTHIFFSDQHIYNNY